MIKSILILILLTSNFVSFGQTIDEPFSKDKMIKDLEVFKKIRLKANSGLYKYRTKKQIDSIYNWADNKIQNISTYREFYNLITTLTDYEGSCHNNTSIPNKIRQNLRQENYGYFPLPIKWIDGKWLVNFEKGDIPLGTEIVSINKILISDIIPNLYKYQTTDGKNITGKRIGLRTHFARDFRLEYGLKDDFNIIYKRHNSNVMESITINDVSYADYYRNFRNRHSKPYDNIYYKHLKGNQKYNYKKIDSSTSMLIVKSFEINNSQSEFELYVKYLDSIFTSIKGNNVKNLIIDIRFNSGGDATSLLKTYEYLADRKFSENKSAWISFRKVPFLRYIDSKIPKFLRPIGVFKYNKMFKEEFPVVKEGKYYEGDLSQNHIIRSPNNNVFSGDIYLLVNPESASAASNFGSLLASNKNVKVIGEETIGGFYGHNGHIPITYILPKSKIITDFSIVNVEQYVIEKPNQIYGRGIIPDYNVSQTYEHFINNKDTQLDYIFNLINEK
jgi:hypothetical protein